MLSITPRPVRVDEARLGRIDTHFARYIDEGRLAGWQVMITREDDVIHSATCGYRDREAGLPVTEDTLWRMYSMTKPVTSVLAMMLWEEGCFELTDPISRWIPAFDRPGVYCGGSSHSVRTEPAREPITVWHLLTHTSGLTASLMHSHVVDGLYRTAQQSWGLPYAVDLAESCNTWATLPLLFQPGTAWAYGVSTDVLGRLIEIWTGQRLDDAIRQRVTAPLRMPDTVWFADPTRQERLAAIYAPHPSGTGIQRLDLAGVSGLDEPRYLSGGGGLLSTAADYIRFARMLERGGELEGERLLAPRTVNLMTSNHLDRDIASSVQGGFADSSYATMGFGLGFAVQTDPVRSRNTGSAGEFSWGGAASTLFWVDPQEHITAVFCTQFVPATAYPLRAELRNLLYSALCDER